MSDLKGRIPMRKLISLFLVLVLSLSVACALAEDQPDNFLISDWQYIISYDGQILDEETVFIYEDGTFEAMTEEETAKGTWTFDGATLVLTRGEEDEKMELSLKWDEGDHLFTGVFNGMDVVLSMNVQPETEDAGAPEGMVTGGWAAAEDPAVTDAVTALVAKAQEQLMGVDYVPVAYLGSQVVAGTNHAILCKATTVVPDAQPRWVIMYLYEDLEGNVSVLDIADLTLGI